MIALASLKARIQQQPHQYHTSTRLVPDQCCIYSLKCIMSHYNTVSNPYQKFHASERAPKPLMNAALSLDDNSKRTHLDRSKPTNGKPVTSTGQSEEPKQNFSFDPNLAYISPPDNYHSKNIHFLF